MDSAVQAIARSAAEKLSRDLSDPVLVPETERILNNPDASRSETYEPIALSIAALIVSVASLAWTIYTDTRKANRTLDKNAVSRRIRVQLTDDANVAPPTRDAVIEVVVEETLRQ